MACVYYYKNLKYNSELELDESLLQISRLSPLQLDLVFSKQSSSLKENAINEIKKKNLAARLLQKEAERIDPKDEFYGLDDVIPEGDGISYISVTECIKTIKFVDEYGLSHHVVPIWKGDEFWSHMMEKLSKLESFITIDSEGNIESTDEYVTPELIKYLFGNEKPHNITSLELPKYRARVESIWKSLSLLGNFVHSTFRTLFDYDFKLLEKVDSKSVLEIADDLMKFVITNERNGEDELIINKKWDNATLLNNGKQIGNKKDIVTSVVSQAIRIAKVFKRKYKNPAIFTEVKVFDEYTKNPKLNVLGLIDMLVIDDDMNIDVYDYKCSPKAYRDFNSAKILTFLHLLAMYRRLVMALDLLGLKRIGINVIPILFLGFNYLDDGENKGHIEFTGIALKDPVGNNIIDNLDNSLKQSVEENINEVFASRFAVADSDNIESSLKAFMEKSFPEYSEYKDSDPAKIDERVAKYIENKGGILKSEENGKYYFFDKKNNKSYTGDSEKEIVEKITDRFTRGTQSSRDRAMKLADILSEAQKGKPLTIDSFGKLHDVEEGTFLFAERILSKYANPLWQTMTLSNIEMDKDNGEYKLSPDLAKILLNHGIILLRNKVSGIIDVIKCSNDDLYELEYLGPKYKKRRYILGTYLSDDALIGQLDSLALIATKGNIELMESMCLLNCIPHTIEKLGGSIGEIKVINTEGFKGIGGLDAPNELLMWNFNRLCSLGGFKDVYIANGNTGDLANIHMCSYIDLVYRELLTIQNRNEDGYYKWFDDKLTGFITELQTSVLEDTNKEKQLLLLGELKEHLESKFPYLKNKPKMQESYESHPEYILYNDVLLAIAQLNKITVALQLENNPRYFKNISKIPVEGWQGLMWDNPGMWQSLNLNKMAYATERAYQNVRVAITKFNEKLLQEIKVLKEEKGFGWTTKVTFGNQANIYLNLYDPMAKKNGLFLFRELDDPTLTPAESKVLNFAVRQLALKRYGKDLLDADGNFDELSFMVKYKDKKEEVLMVPLIRGDFASKIASSGGVFNALKIAFRRLMPLNIASTVAGQFYEFLDDKGESNSQKSKAKSGELYEMVNRIKNSYNEDLRQRLLVSHDDKTNTTVFHVDEFETNLEKILLTSEMAYDMEEELNKVFPLIKAIIAGLVMLGAVQNTNFNKDIELATDYIKNKILGLPLEDMELFGVAKAAAQALMGSASKLALAFNIRQLYLILDGIWKDIMLILLRPDVAIPDDTAFTKRNMMDSFFYVTKDIWHTGDLPTVNEALNRLYGINDMDINVLLDRLSTDNAGIFNFWSLGFRFSSRPDYYNRMTIFGAQMRKDGCFEAHSINEKGELIYDWTKDKRFELYANGKNIGSEQWKQLKALYLTMAKEFIREGALIDGKPFKLGDDNHPTALPRAYTTQQSESIKALADKIYGYYSHEKRSMILSYTLGAMMMQLHTYWSSKKNLYFASHTFSLQGDYEQYTEITTDENGNLVEKKYWIDEKGMPTDQNTGVPYLVWKGRPQEGIVVTLMNIIRDLAIGYHDEDGSIALDENNNKMKGWTYMSNKYFGEHANAKLKALYRANLILLCYDLLMFFIVGQLIAGPLLDATNKHIKQVGNSNLEDAFINALALNSVSMLRTSTEDFNFITSVFGQAFDWSPFSISMLRRTVSLPYNLLFSDKDSFDLLINYASATRNTKPLWDYAKYSSTGRFIGEKAA